MLVPRGVRPVSQVASSVKPGLRQAVTGLEGSPKAAVPLRYRQPVEVAGSQLKLEAVVVEARQFEPRSLFRVGWMSSMEGPLPLLPAGQGETTP